MIFWDVYEEVESFIYQIVSASLDFHIFSPHEFKLNFLSFRFLSFFKWVIIKTLNIPLWLSVFLGGHQGHSLSVGVVHSSKTDIFHVTLTDGDQQNQCIF